MNMKAKNIGYLRINEDWVEIVDEIEKLLEEKGFVAIVTLKEDWEDKTKKQFEIEVYK